LTFLVKNAKITEMNRKTDLTDKKPEIPCFPGFYTSSRIASCAFAGLVAIMVFVFTGCDDGSNDTTPTPKDVAVTSVTLDQEELVLDVGENETLTATVLPLNTDHKNVRWVSSRPGVATVSDGIVTAKADGIATITVISEDGNIRANCRVVVGPIAVESVTLITRLDLFIGDTEELIHTVVPEDAAIKSVSWLSNNTRVATVSRGIVTARAEGTAIITVTTADGNKKASCIVTVSPVAVIGVTLNQTLVMEVWNLKGLSPEVKPENATNKLVSWSSDKPNVATVSSNGIVTGVGGGTATITVSTEDGGFKAACEVTVTVPIVPEISVVPIASGTFTMGSPVGEPARYTNEVQHEVRLTKGFYMGKYQVTQAQYKTVMKINPSRFNVEEDPALADLYPVDSITWYDALEFCNRQSVVEGLAPVYTISDRTPATGFPITRATVTVNWNANGYRLPTEAEWEYACRAGTTTAFSFIDKETREWGSNYIHIDQANFDGYEDYNGRSTSPNGEGHGRTLSVSAFEPNAWGLYNMHGNVAEWCWDWLQNYDMDSPIDVQTDDPRGAEFGAFRLLRGGSWFDPSRYLRSACRNGLQPGYVSHPSPPPNSSGAPWTGFRVVRNLEE
jgi:formylglycine-generating enzyme required for sulfatase activity/uncharacterized protein YjdB